MALSTKIVNLGGIQIAQAARKRRVPRRPRHTFFIQQKCWQIQPFFIAPVLPGETMRNLAVQSRSVTDPITNKLIGWWCEQYYFYVKHRDLVGRDDFTEMMLDQNKDLSAYDTAADVVTFHYGPHINWTRLCLNRVVQEYFRDEGESELDHVLDGLPLASIGGNTYLDSAIDTTTLSDGGALPTTTIEEADKARRQWEFLRYNQLTELDYSDYLAQFGIREDREEAHRPELLRYIRDWTYPTNTINPSTGVPTSACVWSIQEAANKDRFFKEPGFLFGVQVVRPKVYLKNARGAAVSMMRDALGWLPAIMADDPGTSLREYAKSVAGVGVSGGGSLHATTNDYWVDLKDIFLYGDQFVNFDLNSATARNIVRLPTAALEKRFASDADNDDLFVDVTNKFTRTDGVVSLDIDGHQIDTTPTTNA